MRRALQMIVIATGLIGSLATVPVFSQTEDHSKMGKMSGTKMSHEEMTARIDKMSTDDKAALVDKMSVKDKKAAMKTPGQDVSKMSVQEKADMFDKMPDDMKMTTMMQQGGKMGNMGKTAK